MTQIGGCRRQGVIYFCVESNSVHVLKVILRAACSEGFPSNKKPNLRLTDDQQCLPIRHALNGHRFECIRLLVAAGALQGQLQPFFHILSEAATSIAPGPSVQPSLFEAFLNNVADPLKRKEQKLKSFENELMTTEAFEEVLQAEVLENQDAVCAVLLSAIEALVQQASLDPSSALTLLSENDYHLPAALDAALTNPSVLQTEQPSVPDKPATCIVCFEEITDPAQLSIQLPCRHVTCNECWKGMNDR